ncbi:hypothetical protein A3C86_03160 [Candidatus Kaiserbacteria bacterium RIFCSPHIGHO2_02_FULL_49_16]|uniref:Uncharacterized protein n=1 Tax=Candidatus Kaiserbacteria bacterium RIFCSPHIGHO2_02_FULL_49_16 TaxID=1798490 RepID=A0A1F6DFF5_9BACT|nr:MAG: hypothetical protein A3C86_03160 [Candidatus Kaiserbacteria bacterium RIFCSPHIGHO2_02_FULL_49_16]
MDTAAEELVDRFTNLIINPTVWLVFTAGLFLFLWGLVTFIFNLGEGGENTEGKQHMLWGLIGMFVMVGVLGIIALLNNTFNLGVTPDARRYEPDMSRLKDINSAYKFVE